MRWLVVVVLIACLATTGLALAIVVWRPHSLTLWPAAGHVALAGGLLVALWFELKALVRVRRSVPAAWQFRAVFSAAVLTVATYIAYAAAFKALFLVLHLGVSSGVIAWLLAGRRELPARFARLDFVVFLVCVVTVASELGLRVVSRVSDSPVFARSDSPASQIERYRFEPGQLHYGFPCNSQGYPDVEPIRREGRHFVTTIGDSFSHGTVPHAFHYTTVCEQVLGDTDVNNVGVTTTGPAEYLELLERHVLPVEPDRIVVSLFVGNDVHDSLRYRADYPLLRDWFDRDRCQLVQVPWRLMRIRAETERRGREAGRVQGELDDVGVLDREGLVEHYPWLVDPSLEVATFSPEAYADAEYTRIVAACNPDDLAAYHRLFEILAQIRERAHPIPIAAMLIPDEFQVEDSVWETALAGRSDGRRFERDQPQRLIGEWLERQGVPCLDLLPICRAVEPLADGDRHLYHLRDTHFNARGNEVAGRALAEFLRAWR